MEIITTEAWEDYELIDSGEGRRLERFREFILDRPDPQIIWKKANPEKWKDASAYFDRTHEDKGEWVQNISIPERWPIHHKNISFWIKLTPFKHTGVFPEQAPQWDFIYERISSTKRGVSLLNLFGYTGIASLFAAKAGARVTHLDASKPAVTWANENRDVNGMQDAPIRWIVDDALKFTEREIKRGIKYDAIIMDPPVYGHGPKGDIWDFSHDFPKLLDNCKQILSDKPMFVIVNTYATSMSSISLSNVLEDYFDEKIGKLENGELGIKETSRGRILSTGIWARWSAI